MRLAQKLYANRSWNIEFQGYLSNHAKHAIVALDKLGAPETRIQEYWDQYTTLTPYNLELEKVPKPWDQVKPATNEDWKTLRGKKEHFQELCVYLDEQRKDHHDGDVQSLVRDYAPDLLGGIAGALTHGIIHLGWGLDAKSNWMTVEGLAYLNFCHLGVDESEFQDNAVDEKTPMQSMTRIAQEWKANSLGETWVAASKAKFKENFHPELVVAGFQWQLSKVLATPHPVATKLPTWLSTSNLEHIWKDLYQTCLWIYLATRDPEGNGNFLILHLLTSLWGLEQVCRVIDDPIVERKALKQFYASLICLLAASSGGFPTVESLQKVQTEFPLTEMDDKETFDWARTVSRALQEVEEHNIKLVYVLKELWNRYGQWHGFSEAASYFTLTPNIGPSSPTFKA
jgi:hypothetical protein